MDLVYLTTTTTISSNTSSSSGVNGRFWICGQTLRLDIQPCHVWEIPGEGHVPAPHQSNLTRALTSRLVWKPSQYLGNR